MEDAPPHDPRLQPVSKVGDEVWVALFLTVAAIPTIETEPRIASAQGARDDVTRALDVVLAGV
jgi:hypothetical protein